MKKTYLLLVSLTLAVLLVACAGNSITDELTSSPDSATASESASPSASENTDEYVADIDGIKNTGGPDANPDTPANGGSTAGNSSGKTTSGKSSSQQQSNPGTNPPANSTPPTTSSTPSTPPTPSDPPKPAYTEEDYKYIINTVRKYAEGKKTMVFEFDESIKMDRLFRGWHGTPSLAQKGIDGVISTLKYHADLTEQLILGQVGDEFVTITYNITWFQENGEIYFVLIY